jgi:hypothetical protein
MWSLLFAFVLGGVAALCAAFFALAKFLAVAEDKILPLRTEKKKKKPGKEGAKGGQEGQNNSAGAPLVGQMRLFLPSDVELQRAARRWVWCVLNSNFLFVFETERGARRAANGSPEGKKSLDEDSDTGSGGTAAEEPPESPIAVLHLDGVVVEPLKRRRARMKVLAPNAEPVLMEGRPVWKKKFPLVLTHADRALWEESKVVHVKFREGRDAEAWFARFRRASGLHGRTDAGRHLARDANSDDDADREAEMARVAAMEENWATLAAELQNREPVENPDFASAIASRIFWGLHDNRHFLEFIRYKIRKELEDADLPPGKAKPRLFPFPFRWRKAVSDPPFFVCFLGGLSSQVCARLTWRSSTSARGSR